MDAQATRQGLRVGWYRLEAGMAANVFCINKQIQGIAGALSSIPFSS